MKFNERTGDWEGADVPRRKPRGEGKGTFRIGSAPQQTVTSGTEIDWDRVNAIAQTLDERASQRSREYTAAMNRYFDAVERDYKESEEHPFRYFLKKLFRK